MSDLGKFRAGSPRVFRDRVVSRGEIIAFAPELSVDGLRRMAVHPDDLTEEQVAELTAALEAREAAQAHLDAVLADINALLKRAKPACDSICDATSGGSCFTPWCRCSCHRA